MRALLPRLPARGLGWQERQGSDRRGDDRSGRRGVTTKRSGILLVGCGKMGGALLAGWKKKRLNQPLAVVEPQPIKLPAGVKRYASADALPKRFAPAAIVLAVKPQSLA